MSGCLADFEVVVPGHVVKRSAVLETLNGSRSGIGTGIFWSVRGVRKNRPSTPVRSAPWGLVRAQIVQRVS
jgi:hypothetical protein